MSTLLLLLLTSSVTAKTYFVATDFNSTCPSEPCLNISQYASQAPDYFQPRTSLLFLPGQHLLAHNLSLQIHHLEQLMLECPSCGGTDNATLICLSGGLVFSNITNVTITDLMLVDCYGSTVRDVGTIAIQRSVIKAASRPAQSPPLSFGDVWEVVISNSSFLALSNVVPGPSPAPCSALRLDDSSAIVMGSRFERNRNLLSSPGMICATRSQLTLADSTFANNLAMNGGVVYAESSEVAVRGSNFTGNMATTMGGVMQASNSTVSIEASNFSANQAAVGGVVYARERSNVLAVGSVFADNHASKMGGSAYLTSASHLTLDGCVVRGNNCNMDGGGVSAAQGSRLNVSRCLFAGNAARNGGGMFVNNSTVSITNSTCESNTAKIEGGCAYVRSLSPLIITGTNVFQHNRAADRGGAINIADGPALNVTGNQSAMSAFLNNSARVGGALYLAKVSTTHLRNVTFEFNSGSLGGALVIQRYVTLHLSDCAFLKNRAGSKGGAIFAKFVNITSSGNLLVAGNEAGIGVMHLTSCTVELRGNTTFSSNRKSFLARDSQVTFADGHTTFIGGVVDVRNEGGGVTVVRSMLTLRGKVMFEHNKGVNGGALLAVDSQVSFGQTRLHNNTADCGGGVYANKGKLRVEDDTDFVANHAKESGGGVHALRTTIEYSSYNSSFLGNLATHGGALYLDQTSTLSVIKKAMECPYTYCTSNSSQWLRLIFANNTAAQRGGAIYVNDTGANSCSTLPWQPDPISGECFLQTIAAYDHSEDVGENWRTVNFANVYFRNNSAPSGGLLYGGLLDRCSLDEFAEQHLIKAKLNPLTLFLNRTKETHFNTKNKIASDPVRVCFCEENGVLNCDISHVTVNAKRGETFNLSVAVVNQVHQLVSGSVMAYLSSRSSRLGNNQSEQLVNATCSTLNYSVYSLDSETLYLYTKGPCSDQGISLSRVTVRVPPTCPVGFALSRTSLRCECDPAIRDYITECYVETESVIREGSFWISSNDTEKEDNASSIVIHSHCPYDYCYPSTHRVAVNLNIPHGSNAQCTFNRSGRLCGSCAPGYSMTLGGSRCMRCSHYWLLLIVPFLLAGVALVALLMTCNLTLAVGTINGPLFYANILIANRATFFPFQQQNPLTVFVSWLGLNLGIATCFYEGMDGFGKTWVQISFEAYLVLLVLLIIWLGKNMRVAGFLNRHRLHPVDTLATLLMLSYEKLSRRVFSLLAYTTLREPAGRSVTVWLFDPSLDYMEGRHISLAIVAALVILAGILFHVILLLSKAIISRSTSVYLNTFLEAFHAPFKPRHKYWAGLLLLVRNLSYFTSEFLNAAGNPAYNLGFVFAVVTLLLAIKLAYACTSRQPHPSLWGWLKQLVRGRRAGDLQEARELDDGGQMGNGIVYMSAALDFLESSFLLNLAVLTFFTLYIRDSGGNQGSLFYASSSVVLVMCLGILAYHAHKYRMPGTCGRRRGREGREGEEGREEEEEEEEGRQLDVYHQYRYEHYGSTA